MSSDDVMALKDDQIDGKSGDSALMRKARSMNSSSISFLDGSLRKKVEKNVAHFNNKHAKGSKFASSTYRNRNKMFHPKTRNGVRSNEASFAAAMFSTADLVSVSAVDENKPRQQASAEIQQELLNYRLDKTIRDVPMYACDVISEMESIDTKTGKAKWNNFTIEQLISATEDKTDDSTRRARNNDKGTDPEDDQEIDEYKTIWLRQYFIREDGEELVFWTVGDSLLLADPIPLKEAYLHGERPITLGICILEAHKAYPSSPVELNSELQERSNSLVNQRADNVDLVLNKRYYIRRNSKIDTQALMRNVPGGGVLMDDINADIRTENTPDVTSSSYADQDRLDVSMDEASGVFSQSSVQNNRALNETVGGMEMMNSGASAISEYTIRTFVETWVEPTLRHLVKLEAAYETDETVLALAAGKTELFQKYGQDLSIDSLLDAELTVRVNVGMGATSPQQKLNRLQTSVMTVAQIAPQSIARIKEEEIIKEVFGAAGFKDGARFFEPKEGEQAQSPQDPMIGLKLQEMKFKQQQAQQDKHERADR